MLKKKKVSEGGENVKRSTQNVNRLRTPLIWVIVIVVILQKLGLKRKPYKLINLTLNIIFPSFPLPKGTILATLSVILYN